MQKITLWDILFWIIIIILLIMIMTRIFGNSATDVQIYLGFISGLIMIVGYILKLSNNINELNIKIMNTEHKMIDSFKKVREDINKLRK